MKTVKLLKHVSLYPVLARFQFKKNIPDGTQGRPVAVDFGLWGVWYLVKGPGGLLCADGGEMPFHEMHHNSGTVVLGPRDTMAAEGTIYAEAWRESYHESIRERLQLQPS